MNEKRIEELLRSCYRTEANQYHRAIILDADRCRAALETCAREAAEEERERCANTVEAEFAAADCYCRECAAVRLIAAAIRRAP